MNGLPMWRGLRGRGIAGVTFVLATRMLRITYDDLTTEDVGPLPVGEGGSIAISADAGNTLEMRVDGIFAPSTLITTDW